MLAEQKLGLYDSDGHGVRPGDIALDCGANVGVYTLRTLASGAAHVVAIEPAPRNLTCLRRNLAEAVQAGRVTIVPKGLWGPDELLYASRGAEKLGGRQCGAPHAREPQGANGAGDDYRRHRSRVGIAANRLHQDGRGGSRVCCVAGRSRDDCLSIRDGHRDGAQVR